MRPSPLGAIALLASLSALSAPSDPVAAATEWSPLRIGGAGWVTGLALHPTSPGVVYARTDVGGAYRWNADDSTWTQLVTVDAVPDGVPSDYDVESIAIAPSDDSVLYLAVGSDDPGGGPAPAGTVLRSVDGGASFARSERTFGVNGNGQGRQGAERLAVDPADARRVLFGTRFEGLALSTDGARTWTDVPTLPAGDTVTRDSLGVKFVLFDPTTTVGGSTPRVCASVSGEGVFRSDDGGASWTNVLGPEAGIGFDAEVTARGELVVAFQDGAQLRRYDPAGPEGGTWTDISPQTRQETAPVSLAVDPFDADRIFYARSGVTNGRLFRSTDGGASWETLGTDVDVGEVAWRDGYATDFLSVGSVEFDPTAPGRLWFPEGFGALRSEDLDDDAVTWELLVDGIEELVGTDVVAPPGGRPVTTHLDASIFYHPSPGGDAFDAIVGPTRRFNSGYDIAYAASDPTRLAAVVQDQRRFCCAEDGLANQSGLSDDGGRTWRRFASLEDGTHPEDLIFGNIEISSNDPDNLVWLPSFDAPVRWSDDAGATWNVASIPGTSIGSHQDYFLDREVLVADPVAPGTFYLHHDDLGTVRSADGGRSWEVLGFGPIITFARFNSTMKAAPGRAGDLWLTPGTLEGVTSDLYRSTDGGGNWAIVERLKNVESIGFGAPAAPGGYPAIYVAGELDGARSLWRSDDEGASWEDLGFPLGIYDDVAAIAGDPDAFGTVYVNIGGTGAVVGREGGPPPQAGACDVALAGNRAPLPSNRWMMMALPCVPPAGGPRSPTCSATTSTAPTAPTGSCTRTTARRATTSTRARTAPWRPAPASGSSTRVPRRCSTCPSAARSPPTRCRRAARAGRPRAAPRRRWRPTRRARSRGR